MNATISPILCLGQLFYRDLRKGKTSFPNAYDTFIITTNAQWLSSIHKNNIRNSMLMTFEWVYLCKILRFIGQPKLSKKYLKDDLETIYNISPQPHHDAATNGKWEH